MIEALGARQADIVAQPQIERELYVRCSKVVLNETGVLEALRGGPGGDLVTPSISTPIRRLAMASPPPEAGNCELFSKPKLYVPAAELGCRKLTRRRRPSQPNFKSWRP